MRSTTYDFNIMANLMRQLEEELQDESLAYRILARGLRDESARLLVELTKPEEKPAKAK